MEEVASGIILRTRPLTETSLIVQWLTAEQGRVATVAKGARRPKSPFVGKLDLFYEAEFSFVRSRKSELHTLREVALRNVRSKIRQDFERLSAAAYCALLVEQGTERETPVPEFYELAREFLDVIDEQTPRSALIFSLELKFLALSGVGLPPEGLSGEVRQAADSLREAAFETANELSLSKSAQNHLSTVLRRGIGMSLEKLPPQRERLLQALTAA
jgi:DNA repair protein RecO (recombination protein O)